MTTFESTETEIGQEVGLHRVSRLITRFVRPLLVTYQHCNLRQCPMPTFPLGVTEIDSKVPKPQRTFSRVQPAGLPNGAKHCVGGQ